MKKVGAICSILSAYIILCSQGALANCVPTYRVVSENTSCSHQRLNIPSLSSMM